MICTFKRCHQLIFNNCEKICTDSIDGNSKKYDNAAAKQTIIIIAFFCKNQP